MKKKIVRIKDIAERAGTSKGTVDRVLHNRGRVADDVREKVLAIIQEMNYQPNIIARSLKSQKAYNLAALIPDDNVDAYWESPRHGLEKAERELRQYGISVSEYIFDPRDVNSFINKAREVTAERPDGILMAPIFFREVKPFFEEWKSLGIPFVLFNTQIEDAGQLCYIGQDSYRSGFLAAKLLKYGLPYSCSVMIAHVNEDIPNSAHLISKEEGFKNYFDEMSDTYRVIRHEFYFKEKGELFLQLDAVLNANPELRAIYVTTSKAYEIADYLTEKGLSHIKLIGYDLLKRNLNYLNSNNIDFLINQNPHGQGYWGINQLANYLVFSKEILPIKFLPLDIITKENLDYYLDPA